MSDQEQPDAAFNAVTARLIQREALRRATLELATTTPAGLEGTLARISAEVTAEAAKVWEGQARPEPAKEPMAPSLP